MSDAPRVKGECPACGCRFLILGKGGWITCTYIGCPNPSAPSEALNAREVHERERRVAALAGGGAPDE